jgi:hypothetical protein
LFVNVTGPVVNVVGNTLINLLILPNFTDTAVAVQSQCATNVILLEECGEILKGDITVLPVGGVCYVVDVYFSVNAGMSLNVADLPGTGAKVGGKI